MTTDEIRSPFAALPDSAFSIDTGSRRGDEHGEHEDIGQRGRAGRPQGTEPVLREGDTGPAVRTLQAALVSAGHKIPIDGRFGDLTARALRGFQSDQGIAADGVAGRATWAALTLSALQSRSTADQPNRAASGLRLGSLMFRVPGREFTYGFTADDLLWTAKLLVHEAGGRDDADNAAVLWAMFNRYAMFTHRVFPTFAQFIRRYSTTLQPVLANPQAAVRHAHKGPDVYVKTGGFYPGTEIPRGQLRRHLEIQQAPWESVGAPARALASRALQGDEPNPGIGLASEFASTRVYFIQRHKREPTQQEWFEFTLRHAAKKRWTFVGSVAGVNQMKNAFFVDNRALHWPDSAVRVVAPDVKDPSPGEVWMRELEEGDSVDFDGSAEVSWATEPEDDTVNVDGPAEETWTTEPEEDTLGDGVEWWSGDQRYAHDAYPESVSMELDNELGWRPSGRALDRNRDWGDRLGWLRHFDAISRLLGFTDVSPDERPFAQAVSRWQRENGLPADGILGPATWSMLRLQLGLSGAPSPNHARLRSTQWLRDAWTDHRQREDLMIPTTILGRATPVNPLTLDAWKALERALTSTGYVASKVWNFDDRNIKGTTRLSLHAYGLATDIDCPCHPFRLTPERRLIRFSSAQTQKERCMDVKAGRADTAFTPEQIMSVEAIRTADGLQVLAWGGRWRTVKDAMHFQINISPAELSRGIVQ